MKNGFTKEKALQLFRHIVSLAFVGFFVLSFFIGATVDPSFVDIARNPYGLFAYALITMMAVFVPSFTTVPVVITATIIWGPWIAGSIALVGWTVAGIAEYSAGYLAKQSIVELVNGGNNLEKKVERVRGHLSLWQIIVARAVVPSFIFGMVRVRFSHYALATVINFIPWAVGSVLFGELIKPYFDEIRPWILGIAFIIAIFIIDYFFIKKESTEASPSVKRTSRDA
jgi:uncharacterized membrane protein YdjX (TVP38/TMEM64 family)